MWPPRSDKRTVRIPPFPASAQDRPWFGPRHGAESSGALRVPRLFCATKPDTYGASLFRHMLCLMGRADLILVSRSISNSGLLLGHCRFFDLGIPNNQLLLAIPPSLAPR